MPLLKFPIFAWWSPSSWAFFQKRKQEIQNRCVNIENERIQAEIPFCGWLLHRSSLSPDTNMRLLKFPIFRLVVTIKLGFLSEEKAEEAPYYLCFSGHINFKKENFCMTRQYCICYFHYIHIQKKFHIPES